VWIYKKSKVYIECLLLLPMRLHKACVPAGNRPVNPVGALLEP